MSKAHQALELDVHFWGVSTNPLIYNCSCRCHFSFRMVWVWFFAVVLIGLLFFLFKLVLFSRNHYLFRLWYNGSPFGGERPTTYIQQQRTVQFRHYIVRQHTWTRAGPIVQYLFGLLALYLCMFGNVPASIIEHCRSPAEWRHQSGTSSRSNICMCFPLCVVLCMSLPSPLLSSAD